MKELWQRRTASSCLAGEVFLTSPTIRSIHHKRCLDTRGYHPAVCSCAQSFYHLLVSIPCSTLSSICERTLGLPQRDASGQFAGHAPANPPNLSNVRGKLSPGWSEYQAEVQLNHDFSIFPCTNATIRHGYSNPIYEQILALHQTDANLPARRCPRFVCR